MRLNAISLSGVPYVVLLHVWKFLRRAVGLLGVERSHPVGRVLVLWRESRFAVGLGRPEGIADLFSLRSANLGQRQDVRALRRRTAITKGRL